jgi:hypothetical protein
MNGRILALFTVLALLLSSDTAGAAYTFQFTDSSGATQTSFNIAGVGQTVDIRVYLLQSGSDTGLSSSGLKSGGVGLSFDQTIATVASTSAITPNAAFDTSSKSVGTGTATANVAQVLNAPITAPTSGADANRILLGTFTFTGVSGGTTSTVTFDPHPAPTNDNVLGNGTVLDSLIVNSSVTITVAVPEPSTFVLTGLVGTGIAAAALRRFRRRQAA